MIITTTENIPNKEITEILGIARGSTVRARNVAKDIFAALKGVVGGEISEYTKLQADSREQALQRMHKVMIITTTENIPNKEVTEILGIARGSTVRARNVAKDIFAALKGVVGGEISEYTKLQADSREQALQRMYKDAEKMGADAVINVRMTTSMVMQGASELLAYGTAVKLK